MAVGPNVSQSTGRVQRSRSQHGQAHQPDLTKLYRWDAPDLRLDSQEFTSTLLKPKGIAPHRLEIDHLIQSIEWREEPGDPVMKGTLQLRKYDRKEFRIVQGDVLLLKVLWFGHWHEVWRMVLVEPVSSLSGGDAFELADPGYLLQESRDNWHFSKSKKGGHPNGWRCHQVTREVARRYKIPLGKIAQGTREIHSLEYDDASPMQILQRAYALERAATGHRFVIRWANGRLNVLPMRRNPLLYVLSARIVDAALSREERGDDFATAVTLRATIKGKNKKAKKIAVKVANQAAIRRYGFIHKQMNSAHVTSLADARTKARRHLNKVSIRKRTLEGLEHPGIAFIRRGDAIQVRMPELGLTGKDAVCFVTAGTWNLSDGQFTMSLDVTFDDPYVTTKKVRKAKDKKSRSDKRSKR